MQQGRLRSVAGRDDYFCALVVAAEHVEADTTAHGSFSIFPRQSEQTRSILPQAVGSFCINEPVKILVLPGLQDKRLPSKVASTVLQ
jgi:hypothetical protein